MEKNKTDLSGNAASVKIKELVSHTHIVLFQMALNKLPINTRPMGIQKVNEAGEIYFFSHKDSTKNAEITQNPYAQVLIVNGANSEYLNLYGKAIIYRDQAEIDELYSAFANTWFEGKTDPNITIIKFTPEEGYYWDTKHGKAVQLIGILVGAITGKQTDDGLSGNLKV
jgi:general stress protein 26